jgi:hypothetical protein
LYGAVYQFWIYVRRIVYRKAFSGLEGYIKQV